VFEIDNQGERIVLKTNKKRITTDAIVLCTNAWSGQLFSWFQNKVTPMRGQIIVTEPVEQFLQPSYCSFVLDYFRQLVDGRVLIGGFRNADVEKEVVFLTITFPSCAGSESIIAGLVLWGLLLTDTRW